jgi:hypothetical protein
VVGGTLADTSFKEHLSYSVARELLTEISTRHLRELLSYWLEIHPKSHMPARASFDPARIVQTLPNIVMIDVERDPIRFKFRLVGTGVNNVFGRDFTGGYFDEEFENYEESIGYNQRIELVDERIPKYYFGKGKLKYSLDYKSLEWIHLPFSSDGKNVDIIISALSYGDD